MARRGFRGLEAAAESMTAQSSASSRSRSSIGNWNAGDDGGRDDIARVFKVVGIWRKRAGSNFEPKLVGRKILNAHDILIVSPLSQTMRQ